MDYEVSQWGKGIARTALLRLKRLYVSLHAVYVDTPDTPGIKKNPTPYFREN